MNLRKLFAAKDMTQGAPWHRIAEFAVPMLIGNIAQQLYNTADSVIVGRFVGDNALAAVGSASPVLNLLLALFVGVSTGAGIVVSQYFGARDREKLSHAIGNCLSLTVITMLLIMFIGPLVTMPMLRLLDTPESIINWCANYLKIFFFGCGGFFFYNILSGILRGMGDSFSALGFLLLAAALNVVLDLLFVVKFNMGVPGVSLATVIAQFISAVFCFVKLRKMNDVFYLDRGTLKLRKSYAGRIISVGIPSGVTQGIMSLSMLIVQSLTNSLGELVIACNVIIMRVDGFAMMPNFSFGQAMGVYTGQNVGAGKFERVNQGLRQGGLMAVAFSAAITVALLVFGKYLFAIFTDTQELIDLAVRMMRILAVGYICVAVTQVLGGVMRGAGDTVTPMWISIITTIVIRMPLAYLFAYFTRVPEWPNGQPKALFVSLLITWICGSVLSAIAYSRGKWKKIMQESQRLANS